MIFVGKRRTAAAWLTGLALMVTASAALAQTPDRLVLPDIVTPTAYAITVTPDVAASTFAGHVEISVTVKTPTPTLEFNAADLTFSKVALDGQAGAPQVAFDAARQTVTLTFAAPVAAGEHRLTIDYAGTINIQADGLFKLGYDTPGGRKQALFTQFENSDARRFVPSWDEPNRKATFTLSAIVPAASMAVSNMPAASQTALPGGLKRVDFATTPRMSTYLLFFGDGDFDRIHRDVDGTDVGVVFKRGDASRATYALDAAAHILPYYNTYFGVKYPLPKLDLVAGPGQSQFFGAMENWGAIFTFEYALLIDPKTATEHDRQTVYVVAAHEMAHQWFGDLVTMDWWDDLWLNEGFASWMEVKATDHFHPEWRLPLQDISSKDAAMRLDAREGTHPVITHVRDVLQANQAFDAITYQKGRSVIGMLESYVGDDVWRAGVGRYMKAHAYGNTTTDDLWREVDAVSPLTITAIAHDFTLQPGVPLISPRASCVGGRTVGVFAESRFGVDATSKAPLGWRVPVAARILGGETVETLVSPESGRFSLNGCGPWLANAGQQGYFRVDYTPGDFSGLLTRYASLPAADQIGLADDSLALGQAGYAPMARFLDITDRAPPGADPVVLSALIGGLSDLDDLLTGLPSQAPLRAHARRTLAPIFARVGWDARAAESPTTALLRAAVLGALSQFDDPAVIAEARRRFTLYLAAPDSVSPDVRRVMLRTVARHADAAEWDRLHALARAAPTVVVKSELYTLLASAEDVGLAKRALALALGGEVDATEAPMMIGSVSFLHPDPAFDFYLAHRSEVNADLEPDSRNQFGPRLANGLYSPDMADKVRAFAQADIPVTARGATTEVLADLAFRAEVRRLRAPEIAAWLNDHGG
jgi:aminopeptidase N